ncbi:MAG: hypothetical protein H7839_19860 [Magnetococcus sp. YQC-5]
MNDTSNQPNMLNQIKIAVISSLIISITTWLVTEFRSIIIKIEKQQEINQNLEDRIKKIEEILPNTPINAINKLQISIKKNKSKLN